MSESEEVHVRTLAGIPLEQKVSLLGPKAGDLLKKERIGELHDVPDNVPFAFLGAGLSILYDKGKGGSNWRTYEWDGPIPAQYQFGAVYLADREKHEIYKKVASDGEGKWKWEKVDVDAEQERREQGIRPPWQERKYFDEDSAKDAGELNKRLNSRGWTTFCKGEHVNADVKIPAELKSFPMTPLVTGSLDVYILYDPERAEVLRLRLNELDDTKERKMVNEGWQLEDWGFPGRTYVRTKPEVWNKSVNDETRKVE